MSYEQTVSDHYLHGNLLRSIEDAIPKLGKTLESITVEDLGPVDEFHIGGRIATDRLLSLLNFPETDHILDVGCGLGGASRYIASNHGNRITGIDLAQEYIDTGNVLCSWVGLDNKVTLQQGSALDMPFKDESFEGGLMLHVGMNIEDKTQLFAEIYRVLKPGAVFGVYDVMQINEGELSYPVPWATENSTSKLASPDQYKEAITAAGFTVSAEENRRDFALEFFKKMKAKTEAMGGPPPLGLHTLMKESTPIKLKNMVENIAADLIAPIEIIIRKTASYM
jgi:ubiquinone/menaquinone biosynthesis C-methylase UbiE